MRLILMSDVHGNLPALRAVLDSLPQHDAVVVAGDHCLDGPRPADVLDLLDDLGWSLVLGNTDRDIVAPPTDATDKKREVVQWTREELGSDRLERLASLPFSVCVESGTGESVLVVHANPCNLDDHLRPTMSEDELRPYLQDVEASVLAFGHLHVPYVRPVGDVLLVDVSSVGHPKDHDRRAAYCVLTWENGCRSLTQYRVPYDVDVTVQQLQRSGMPYAAKQIRSLLAATY